MKDNRIKRFLALVLAASMILSDVSMAVYAAEEEERSVYCGLEEHTHGDICVDSAGIMVCSETEHIHNEECYVNTENEEKEAVEEPEGTEETQATEETEAEELPLMERLMRAETLEALFNLIFSEAESLAALTMDEVASVNAYTQSIYDALDTPTELEQGYYAQIMDTLVQLLRADEETEAAEETKTPSETTEAPNETTEAPSETTEAPSETTETSSETTEAPSETTEAPSEITENPEEAEATEETETTEETEEAESEDETADIPLMDRLMATQTLQELHALMVAEEESMKSLSLGEVSAVKGQTQTLYDKIENPTEEEMGYYDQIMATVYQLLGGEKLVRAVPDLSNGGTVNSDTEWTLSGDVTLKNTITVASGVTVTIDLNGFVLTVDSDHRIAHVYGTLIITDSNATKVHYGRENDGTWTYSDEKQYDNDIVLSGGIITGKGNEENWGGAICVEPNATLEILGGTISNFTGKYGGAIHNAGVFTMKGGTISDNNAKECGGGVHTKGTFDMIGGIISGNGANNGGGVAEEGSKITVIGGTISNNTAINDGGGIYIWNDTYAELSISNGTINGNTANVGGGVYVNSGTFNMSGGTISNNTATSSNGQNAGGGGGVYTISSFTMTGGTISGNKAKNGGGVTAAGGQFVLNGGTLSGNTADSDGGGIYEFNSDTVVVSILSGNISNNKGAWGGGIHTAKGMLNVNGGTISENNATTNGGGICFKNAVVTMSGGTVSNNTTSGNGGGIFVESGELILDNGTVSNNTASSGGGIYNQGTVTMNGNHSSSAAISENHSNSHGGGVYNAGTFTMTYGTISKNRAGNTSGNDSIDGKPIYSSNWGGGVYTSGSNFTMENGIITENCAASGGGVGVWGGSFDMKGGTISNNNAYGSGGPGNGGAAYVNGATFNFYAGTIEHNWARRYGGAINLNEGGKLFLHGTKGECIIQYNSANNGGGISQEQGLCEMTISHENIKIIHNIARDDNREVTAALKANGCGGGLFVEKGTITFSAGTIANNTAVAGGGIALRVQRIAGDITVNMTGGTLSGNTATSTGGGIDISADFDDLDSETFNKVEVNLIDGKFERNISQGTGGGIDIWVNEANSTAEMYIGSEGNAEGPELTDNEAAANGGAIRMRSGSVNLYSGEISGNAAGQYGGGITVNGGNFTMSGGTIGGTAEDGANTAGNGGGGIALRIVESASDITVTMTGGTISGNKAEQTGGGIDIYADYDDGDSNTTNMVRVDLINGRFENNTSMGTGGGIDIWVDEENSFAEMHIGKEGNTEGPEFTGNEAASNGGAIRMRSGNIFLHGGTITGNKAKSNGGAISVNGGDFTMYNGVVSQNTVTEGYGGGIALSNGTVLISNGSVINNKAKVHGGGIVVSNGEVIMAGGVVSNNVAETGNGGGVYVTSVGGGDVAVKIFSGEVANNRAPNGSGGGVAVNGGLIENGATKITVQTGLNALHESTGDKAKNYIPHDREGKEIALDSAEFIHETCPVITNNSSLKSGGGIYITGGSETKLNIYCLTEAENSTVEDRDHNDVLSKFMMVEGGKVIISSSQTGENGVIDPDTSNYGNTSVLSSIHVYAGELYLYGNMNNPAFTDALTVDYRNQSDIFEDYRISDSVIKLTYNENFTDANGKPESTLKAFDIQNGATVTIAELLFKHSGYTIKAWNTKSDGTGIEFNVGDQYVFVKTEADKNKYELKDGQQYWVGDLDLFADWDVNSFLVVYHHNIPEGQPYSGNMDGEHKFTYDQDNNLLANQFVYPGHVFQHWTYTKDDGTQATLTDKQQVRNLTNVRGGTVHLYAVWAECDHPAKEIRYSADGPVLTKHCKQCGQSATVTIQANNAVYDGNKHMYTVVYSDAAFLAPEVTCSAVKFNSTKAPDNLYVDAGQYTVTTNESGSAVQATLTYTIEKAEQKAPVSLPTYDTPKENDHTVKIHQTKGEMNSPESSALIEYTVRYTKDGKDYDLDWKSDATGGDVTFELIESLTTYSVYSRYPETDNYKASPERVAMSSFFFNGNINVLITPTNGVTYTSAPNADSLDITAILEDGYYLEDGNFYVTIKEGNDSQYISVNGAASGKIAANSENTFIIKASGTPQSTVEIHLELGYATKATSVTSKIAPNQVFGTVSGSTATISRDSAYTVCFEVNSFDNAVYRAPQLAFNQSIPVGTRFILVDKSNNSYWYHTVTQSQISYPLKSFKRMGAETSDTFNPTGTDWKLQVIVDFSQVAANNTLSGALRTWLELLKQDNAPINAPDFYSESVNPGVYVDLLNSNFTLKKAVDSQQRLIYSFNSETANVSRWNHRELALILRPKTDIPADAIISAEQNGVTVDYRPVQIPKGNGTETAFLIPLNGFSGKVFLSMESGTAKAGDYYMSTQLVAAASIAENAPVNGTAVVDFVVDVVFSVSDEPLSIKAVETNDCHLFAPGSAMNLNIQIQPAALPYGYRLIAALEQKEKNDTDYSFYGVYYEPTNTGTNYTLSAHAPAKPGNYRIRFYIETANGTNVLETAYYLIVQ